MFNYYIQDELVNGAPSSYYGGYRTRTFANIFPTAYDFIQSFDTTKFSKALIPNAENTPTIDKELVYYLLYARYGNSHISFSDENQFIYNIFATIFMYGPAWAVRLDAQKRIRELGERDLLEGSSATYNQAYNPSTAPSTDFDGSIPYINNQNKTLYKKSKLEAYASLLSLVETDVTEEFINKFKKFFIVVAEPDYPLLYETEVN